MDRVLWMFHGFYLLHWVLRLVFDGFCLSIRPRMGRRWRQLRRVLRPFPSFLREWRHHWADESASDCGQPGWVQDKGRPADVEFVVWVPSAIQTCIKWTLPCIKDIAIFDYVWWPDGKPIYFGVPLVPFWYGGRILVRQAPLTKVVPLIISFYGGLIDHQQPLKRSTKGLLVSSNHLYPPVVVQRPMEDQSVSAIFHSSAPNYQKENMFAARFLGADFLWAAGQPRCF